MRCLLPTAAALFCCGVLLPFSANAHDTWVQTNTNLVRVGDLVHVDLMLGNHGNEHRDYKLASKITIDDSTLAVITPSGKQIDIKPSVVDTGYAPKEGFWSSRFITGEAGVHVVAHTLDKLHGTTRAIKSAKTLFVASPTLDIKPQEKSGLEKAAKFDQPLGHPLEIVPTVNTALGMGPGQPIAVQVLYNGKPLADARVSFIPRSATLAEGFDANHERQTNSQGEASFTPKEGDYVLVVLHHREPDQKGEGYEATSYSATLVVYVPQSCPCCGE